MGSMTTLTATDGHRFGAYIADPKGTPKGGVVVIMEIFGVNGHIRAVCDSYAAEGYRAVAPALYDRVEANVDLGYGADDMAKGRALREKMQWDTVGLDTAVAVSAAASAGKVGCVGYCYGGGVTWYMGAKVPGVAAAVGYYGGPWASLIDMAPQCPSLLHFAAKDKFIPAELAQQFKAKYPTISAYVYDADHGFNCDQRLAVYDATAMTVARNRTLGFFEATLGE